MKQEKPGEENVSRRTERKRKRKSQKAERQAKRLRKTNIDAEDVWGIFTTLRQAEESKFLKANFDANPMNFWKCHQVSSLQKLFRIGNKKYATHEKEVIIGSYLRMLRRKGL